MRGRPTKYSAERRQKVLEALQIGASRLTAAHIAGVDDATLRRWIEKSKEAKPGTMFDGFAEAVAEAEAHPRARALGIIYSELPNRPELAWKFIERREPGYAPPMPNVPERQGPITIELALSGGKPLELKAVSEIIEGEIVADEETGADTPAETPSSAPAASR